MSIRRQASNVASKETPVRSWTKSEARAWKSKKSINEHPSYHGVMTEEAAEELLIKYDGNSYLIRYDTKATSYMLSVMIREGTDSSELKNFIITTNQQNCEIKGTGKVFDHISKLLEFYLHSPKTTDNADEVVSDSITDDEALRKYDFTCIEKRETKYEDAVPTKKLVEISKHPSYHGRMTGVDAEEKLKKHGGTCFLTRYSDNSSHYILSVMTKGSSDDNIFNHFTILVKEDKSTKYEIKGTEMEHNNFFELLTFYQNNSLDYNFANIGECVAKDENKTKPTIVQMRQDSTTEPVPGMDKIQEEITDEATMPNELPPIPPKHEYEKLELKPSSKKLYSRFERCPTLSNLTLMNWTDDEGQKQKIEVIKKISSKCEEIGILLGLSMGEIDNYRQMVASNNEKICSRIIDRWIQKGGVAMFPVTWDGVYDLLCAIELSTEAENLKEVLASKNIHIQF